MTFGNIGEVEFVSADLAALLFFAFSIVIAVLVIVLAAIALMQWLDLRRDTRQKVA